jgi:gluconolactonase
MALDEEGGLIVCQIGIGVWRFDARGIPTHLIESDVGTHMTNVCFGGVDRKTLYITEADSGSILSVAMPISGVLLYSHM